MSDKTPSIETDSSDATQQMWTGLPVVLDEVFTGVYRLGRFSSGTFIDTHADISVHAKLLTGGLLPLCVTLASQSIFEAFLSDEKSDALLHGHSYTAHAVGCHVANVSLKKLGKTLKEPLVKHSQTDWIGTSTPTSQGSDAIWSTWSKAFVENLSLLPKVDGVIAIGSVLAITLVDEAGAGTLGPILRTHMDTSANSLERIQFQRRYRLARCVVGTSW
jgi:dethiobiotin synthetase/adenosylmethionine--8-amino-7-oxononanoate aminotransferase